MDENRSAASDTASSRPRVVVAHKARSFEEAQAWDLAYWLSRTPEERIEALEAMREDYEKMKRAQ